MLQPTRERCERPGRRQWSRDSLSSLPTWLAAVEILPRFARQNDIKWRIVAWRALGNLDAIALPPEVGLFALRPSRKLPACRLGAADGQARCFDRSHAPSGFREDDLLGRQARCAADVRPVAAQQEDGRRPAPRPAGVSRSSSGQPLQKMRPARGRVLRPVLPVPPPTSRRSPCSASGRPSPIQPPDA
jgi:hypothetical protein